MIIDEDLIFNEKTKRYYLTQDYVYNKMGTDLNIVLNDELDTNKESLVARNIEYSCDMIYDFIKENAICPKATFYLFTQDEEMHEALKSALKYQLFDYMVKGDRTLGEEKGLTINERAFRVLNGVSAFHRVKRNIPKEW